VNSKLDIGCHAILEANERIARLPDIIGTEVMQLHSQLMQRIEELKVVA